MSEFDTLIGVLESKVFSLQAEAANQLIEAEEKSFTEVERRAKGIIREAASIRQTINLLNSFRDNKQTIQTTIATPQP